MERSKIFEFLQQDLDMARKKVNSAAEQFDAIISEAPSGLPHPDGVHRIHNASRKLSNARQELVEAHVRLTAFLAQGIIPDNLKTGAPGTGDEA